MANGLRRVWDFLLALKGGNIFCGVSKVGLRYNAFPGAACDYTYRQQNAPSHVRGHSCHGFGTMPSPEELMATKETVQKGHKQGRDA